MSTGLSALLRQPLWRRWTLAAFLGRLPLTMTLLALVLVGEYATGSLAVGAQLAGVATVTAGVAAPLRGRQLDRGGLREGLRNAAVLTAIVLVVLAGAVVAGAPLWLLFLLAGGQGAAFAALSGGFRALLVPVVSAEDLPRANTLEAVFIEVSFVAGPSLAGVVALIVGPVGVLLVMAGTAAASALLVMTLPPVPPHEVRLADPPWRARGARPVYALALLIGISVGLLESALPARAADLGLAAASAGPLLALVAGGSAVGGLFAAGRKDHRRYAVRLAVALFTAFGVLMVVLAAMPTAVLVGVVLFAVGVPIAPLNAIGALRLQDAIPPSRLAEGFALYTAMILIGAGLGQSITGQLLDNLGAPPLLASAGVLSILGGAAVAVVVLRRRRVSEADAVA